MLPAVLAGIVLGSIALSVAAAPHAGTLPGREPPGTSPGTLRPATGSPYPSAGGGPVLSVLGLAPTDASLGWTAASNFGFDNYTVLQSSNSSSGPWEPIGFIAKASSTTLVAESLTPGSTYWWEVQTVSSSLLGGPSSQTSNVVSATMPGLAYLNVTLTDPTTADLTWTNNASYGGGLAFAWYDIYEVAGTSPPGIVGNASSASTHQTSLSPLSAGASYAFYVTTTDCIAGCGGATSTTVTTESNVVTIGTPETLTASINGERSVVDVGQPDLFTCTPSGGKSPYTVSWNNGNGTFVPGPGTESLSFNASGTPNVQCLIRDAASTSASAGTSVAVNPDLVVVAGTNRSTADIGEPIAFSCSASGGTAPVVLTWLFGDGGELDLGDTTHAYATPASVVATCTASDYTGSEVGRSLGLLVSARPDVSLSVNSRFAAPGTTLAFHGVASNGSGNGTALAWTFGDGARATGASPTHAFALAGTYAVEVRSVDSNGVPATANTSILVAPVTAAVTVPSASVTTNVGLRFNASASGGAGAPYNFSWTFGDGARAFGPSVTHAYRSAGHYAPVLVVTDHLGAVGQENLTAVVAVAPPPPAAPANPSWWILTVGAVAFVAGTLGALLLYRRAEAQAFGGTSRWVPMTDPSRTLRGVRVCRNCGTPNNAAREGCSACGAPIGPSLFG
ncbi:MAG TPA: PKD domain-containing protein [Thermoplasmata archaeon]|nr:PKD domain-containing protein [Thermoplasmata archaeon]